MQLLGALLAVSALSASPGPELLDFSATWCGPCQQMAPAIEQLEREGYPVRRVDFDRERALANQYQVTLIPTVILVENGRVLARRQGVLSASELKELFRGAGMDGPRKNSEKVRDPSRDKSPPAASPRGRAGGSSSDIAGDSRKKSPVVRGVADRTESKPTRPDERIMAASVRLKVVDAHGNGWGSGTIVDAVDGEALIVTCAHLFREGEGRGDVYVDLFGPDAPQGIRAELVELDLDADVALVSFRTNRRVTAVPVAPASYVSKAGDRVVSIGCDNGTEPTRRETKIKSVNRFLGAANVQVAFEPVTGRSGGGLFTPDGQLVGVCNAADPTDHEGLFAGLPSVQQLLDRAKLSFVYRGQDPGDSRIADAKRGGEKLADAKLADAGRAPPPMASRLKDALTENRGGKPAPPKLKSPSVVAQGSSRRSSPSKSDGELPGPAGISDSEKAALDALLANDNSAEVICIVRSLTNPRAKSEIIILDHASPKFMQQLSLDDRAQRSRFLTGKREPALRRGVRAPVDEAEELPGPVSPFWDGSSRSPAAPARR